MPFFKDSGSCPKILDYTLITSAEGKFVKVKWVKIPSLATLQVSKYIKHWSNVHEPLKNITYIRKKLFFNILGTNFFAPKSGQQLEKQPVLGPTHGFSTSILGATRNSICSRNYIIWHFISTPTPPFSRTS